MVGCCLIILKIWKKMVYVLEKKFPAQAFRVSFCGFRGLSHRFSGWKFCSSYRFCRYTLILLAISLLWGSQIEL
jgi:hypothetical protein